jgi:hypothetical protein
MDGEGFVDDAPFAVMLEHREVVGKRSPNQSSTTFRTAISKVTSSTTISVLGRACCPRGPLHYKFDECVQRIVFELLAIMADQKTLRVERAPQLRIIGVEHTIKIIAGHSDEFGMLPFTLGW